jgi:hypothetical protein
MQPSVTSDGCQPLKVTGISEDKLALDRANKTILRVLHGILPPRICRQHSFDELVAQNLVPDTHLE